MSLIVTQGLTKTYGTQVTALRDLTVSVEPGIIGLVGANGAGKSTFIKIMLGLIAPTGGQVRVFDIDPTVDDLPQRTDGCADEQWPAASTGNWRFCGVLCDLRFDFGDDAHHPRAGSAR